MEAFVPEMEQDVLSDDTGQLAALEAELMSCCTIPTDLEVLQHVGVQPGDILSDRETEALLMSILEEDHHTLESAQIEEQLNPMLCSVCLAPTDGHIHYGGHCCSSCRGFFRRAAANSDALLCKGTKGVSCSVDSKSRRSCARCRYQKCLEAGMNPSWVITPRERTRNLEKRRRRAAVCESLGGELSPLSSFSLTHEERLVIGGMLDRYRDAWFGTLLKAVRKDPTPVEVLRNQVLYGLLTPPDQLKSMERTVQFIFEEVAFGLDDMGAVNPFDRRTLVESKFGTFFSCLTATYFNRRDFGAHMDTFLQYVRRHVEEDSAFNLVLDVFKELEHGNRMPRLDYDRVYVSPWCANFAAEQHHRGLLGRIQEWPRVSPDTSYDETIIMLHFLLQIFCPAGLSLRDAGAVEKLQQKYAMLLYRYLQSKLGTAAGSKFGKGLMITSMAEEAYEVHKLMLPV